jgi:hypothetical protein
VCELAERIAGSAKAILAAGAQAIATSSWSVAEAQGYRDGEAIPIVYLSIDRQSGRNPIANGRPPAARNEGTGLELV